MNTRQGVGVERMAIVMILISSARQTTFQMTMPVREILPFDASTAMIGAVKPARISQFLPSKVICSGRSSAMNSIHKNISTKKRKL